MALIGNYSVYDKLPLKYIGAANAAASIQSGNRGNFSQSGRVRSRMMQGQTTTALAYYALPNGAYPSLTWFIPQKAGQIGSSNQIYGLGSVTANLAGGKSIVAFASGAGGLSGVIAGLASMNAGLTGAGTATGTASAVAALIAALNGAGTASGALLAAAGIAANLTGSGTASASLAAAASLFAALSGAGTISNADLTLLAGILADLVGSGTATATVVGQGNLRGALDGAGAASAAVAAQGALHANVSGAGSATLVPFGTGLMFANITGESTLSPQNLAAAVWSALAAQYNDPNTMGELLNSAGTAADPLLGIVEGTLTLRDVMRLLLAVNAGDATGLEGRTMVFRSVDGATIRVQASYTTGTRDVTTLNPT